MQITAKQIIELALKYVGRVRMGNRDRMKNTLKHTPMAAAR